MCYAKRNVILVIALLCLAVYQVISTWVIRKKWRDSIVALFSKSQEIVSLAEGEYILYLKGDNEGRVDDFINSLDKGLRFVSNEDGKDIVKLKALATSHKHLDSGFYYRSIGFFKIVRPGNYTFSDIRVSDKFQFVIICSAFNTFFNWFLVVSSILGIITIGYTIWVIKDWQIFHWFVKSVSGISIWKT